MRYDDDIYHKMNSGIDNKIDDFYLNKSMLTT